MDAKEKYYVETTAKYVFLINYLKDLIKEEQGYTTIISVGDLKRILKALEEVE